MRLLLQRCAFACLGAAACKTAGASKPSCLSQHAQQRCPNTCSRGECSVIRRQAVVPSSQRPQLMVNRVESKQDGQFQNGERICGRGVCSGSGWSEQRPGQAGN